MDLDSQEIMQSNDQNDIKQMVSPKDIEVHKDENRTKKNSHKQDPKYDQRNQLTHVGTCLNLHATQEQDNLKYQL